MQIDEKTLVIGLEDVLVYAIPDTPDNYDAELPIIDNSGNGNVIGTFCVTLRPYLLEFLDYISKKYEIIVYCNGSSIYCDPIIDYIESGKKIFAYRIYNEHILFENPQYSVKYYDFLFHNNRKKSNTVIVDSNIAAYCLQIYSGIPIIPYNDKQKDSDNDLLSLANYLDKLIESKNITKEISSSIDENIYQ